MRNSSLLLASFVVVTVIVVGCSGTGTRTGAADGGVDDASLDDASLGDASLVDGGSTTPSTSDAGTKKPVKQACSSEGDFEGASGSCTLQTTYQCETLSGFDAYRVACSCPSAACGCYLNGTLTKTVPFNGCPSCSSPVELAKLCGVAGY